MMLTCHLKQVDGNKSKNLNTVDCGKNSDTGVCTTVETGGKKLCIITIVPLPVPMFFLKDIVLWPLQMSSQRTKIFNVIETVSCRSRSLARCVHDIEESVNVFRNLCFLIFSELQIAPNQIFL